MKLEVELDCAVKETYYLPKCTLWDTYTFLSAIKNILNIWKVSSCSLKVLMERTLPRECYSFLSEFAGPARNSHSLLLASKEGCHCSFPRFYKLHFKNLHFGCPPGITAYVQRASKWPVHLSWNLRMYRNQSWCCCLIVWSKVIQIKNQFFYQPHWILRWMYSL